VHGIGEQYQFEHLEGEARNIISALQKTAGEGRTIQVVVNSLPSAPFGAQQETWQDGERAPVMVEVYDDKEVIQIHFHQVWWADLDEPTTLWTELRFWLWGLSLWTINGKFDSKLPGYKRRMESPKNVRKDQTKIDLWGRLRLFWVALVILLILPVLSLLNFVFRQLLGFKIPRPDILAQYIGDVKLLQQAGRSGKGPLEDLSLPPRVTLRRRMIQGMVEMALRPYERWYILAHSQGTVLAFNGIMETAQSLPNYLTEDIWEESKAKSLIRQAKGSECLTNDEKREMWPTFPSWRDKDYILDRKLLFKNLRGLLTYGSPLSKFALLWPAIVPLNLDRDVFHNNFQWLNVYDPTDPVAGQTQPFQHNGSSSPIDIAYKTKSFHLLSHTKYLTFSKDDRNPLVSEVADWLLTGNKLIINQGSSSWPNLALTRIYEVARVAVWVLLALLIGWLLSELISAALPEISLYFQPAISFALRSIPLWLKWLIAAVYLSSVFSALGSLIGGTRFLWGGLVLGMIAIIVAVFPAPLQFELLSRLLKALIEGVLYISVGGIVVFLAGILVKFFVKDRGKL
jgi:hypothetical protein